MTTTTTPPAAASGTLVLGGSRRVHRLGFGAMRITGPGVWGAPRDHHEAIAVLRRVVELGIDFIDTADSYGPEVSERLIAEALHPYPSHLVIATKAGLDRPGPNRWKENGRPEHLRAACEGSLRRLRLERIDLYQLHRIDPAYPLEDQIGTLVRLREAGKIHLIGVSEVTAAQLDAVRRLTPVASAQNRYNLVERQHQEVLDVCERDGIAFLPWFPLGAGRLAGGEERAAVARIARHLRATPAQVSLAWLLRRSPVMLPIPGTSTVKHLEENVAAAALELSDADLDALNALAAS